MERAKRLFALLGCDAGTIVIHHDAHEALVARHENLDRLAKLDGVVDQVGYAAAQCLALYRKRDGFRNIDVDAFHAGVTRACRGSGGIAHEFVETSSCRMLTSSAA